MKDNTASVHAQVPVDVATFLLNEKRVDLQMIEARHRVSVVLIPNVHLETPNYNVVRLRHDDLNRGEPMAASYNLVEAPAEQERPVTGTGEPAVPRPQAAVRGITPQQPAPAPAAWKEPVETSRASVPQAAEASFISRIFGFFKRAPEEAPPVEQRPAPRPAPGGDRGPRRGRHDRGERDGARRDQGRAEHGGGQRQQRSQAQQVDGQRDRGRGRSDQRQQQQDGRRHDGTHQQRQQQPQRERAPTESGARGPAAAGSQQPREGGEQREGRGRRRRRGRGRHEQREQAAGAPSEQQPQQQETPTPALPPATRIEEIAAVAIAAASAVPQAEPEPAKPTEVSALEASSATTTPEAVTSFDFEPLRPVQEAESSMPDIDVPAVSAPEETPALVVAAPSQERLPFSEPSKIELPSGLEQVESNPEKVRAVETQPDVEEELRPKRIRPTLPPPVEEPLVQVETGQSTASGPEETAPTPRG